MRAYNVKIFLEENKIVVNNNNEYNLDDSEVDEIISNTDCSTNIRFVKNKVVDITYACDNLPYAETEGNRIVIGG